MGADQVLVKEGRMGARVAYPVQSGDPSETRQQLWDLAKTGDTERKQLIVEYALEARNEAASGIVADLTTS